jgi:hypothetical protein
MGRPRASWIKIASTANAAAITVWLPPTGNCQKKANR